MTPALVDTVASDEKHYKGVAEMLDVLPERIIRYRVKDLVVSYCNSAWAAGHRLTPADIIGHSMEEFLSEAEKQGLEAQFARLGPQSPVLADDVARPAPNAPGQWVEWA